MDRLVSLAILLVSGYFILVKTRKRKCNQRSKAELEKESQEVIKKELSRDAPSYEWIRSMGGYGFLYDYLRYTANDELLTTTAKFDIVKTLSKNDLLWDLNLFFCLYS